MKKNAFIMIKILVLIILLLELIKGNFSNVFLCILAELSFLIVDKILFYLNASFLLQLIIYVFIIGSVVLGSGFNFYVKFENFDNVMHYLSGIISGGILYYFIAKIGKIDKNLLIIFIISFSLAVATVWEIFEYTSDKLFKTDMQKDTIVTKITSSLYDENGKIPVTKEIKKVIVNDCDYLKRYGGYIDIGLNDTMIDIIMGFFGTLTYVIYLKLKKKLVT